MAPRDEVLAVAPPQLRQVVTALRSKILAAHPDANELAWPKLKILSFGVGPRKMTDHYAYIAIQSTHINLGFYRGTDLSDPSGLLVGTGQRLRHVKLRTTREATDEPVLDLIQQAHRERHNAVSNAA